MGLGLFGACFGLVWGLFRDVGLVWGVFALLCLFVCLFVCLLCLFPPVFVGLVWFGAGLFVCLALQCFAFCWFACFALLCLFVVV